MIGVEGRIIAEDAFTEWVGPCLCIAARQVEGSACVRV